MRIWLKFSRKDLDLANFRGDYILVVIRDRI